MLRVFVQTHFSTRSPKLICGLEKPDRHLCEFERSIGRLKFLGPIFFFYLRTNKARINLKSQMQLQVTLVISPHKSRKLLYFAKQCRHFNCLL